MEKGTVVIEDIAVGMIASISKRITDKDISMFAQVSTDQNPVHVDETYAQNTIFSSRIAHGMLTASLISAVIGEYLPGHGTIYLSQSLTFKAPVRPDDIVTAYVEVTDIDHKRRKATLKTWCTVKGKSVLSGEASVLVPSRKFD